MCWLLSMCFIWPLKVLQTLILSFERLLLNSSQLRQAVLWDVSCQNGSGLELFPWRGPGRSWNMVGSCHRPLSSRWDTVVTAGVCGDASHQEHASASWQWPTLDLVPISAFCQAACGTCCCKRWAPFSPLKWSSRVKGSIPRAISWTVFFFTFTLQNCHIMSVLNLVLKRCFRVHRTSLEPTKIAVHLSIMHVWNLVLTCVTCWGLILLLLHLFHLLGMPDLCCKP